MSGEAMLEDVNNHEAVLKAVSGLLERATPVLPSRELDDFVRSFIDRREVLLGLCRESGSPLYLLEKRTLLDRAEQFARAFRREFDDVAVYYAVKSNNCPAVISALAEAGLGLDVSSGPELNLALSCGTSEIIFTGPGKTPEELVLAARNAGRVTVLLDSFAELARLDQAACEAQSVVTAGVRLATDETGLWRKFGIPVSSLQDFMAEAERCRRVKLCGLQFHTSWNLGPGAQVAFIGQLGEVLSGIDRKYRSGIEFVDIGGGYWPPQGEWLHPAGTPEGKLRQAALSPSGPPRVHHRLAASPIEEFARRIGLAAREHLFPLLDCRIITEPGRWICNDAMHIILTVLDRKADDLVITDGGTNAVGWERFEVDYFPVINLSRPSTTERPCYVMGSLCTPHDLWGYAYHGEGIEPGDLLLVPTQGAYTYSLGQQFIKPLPKVVVLPAP